MVDRSAAHVGRVINDATGFEYRDLVRGYRLQPAVPEILHSREQIAQIAYQAGYAEVRQFNRDINTIFGLSPTDLRQSL